MNSEEIISALRGIILPEEDQPIPTKLDRVVAGLNLLVALVALSAVFVLPLKNADSQVEIAKLIKEGADITAAKTVKVRRAADLMFTSAVTMQLGVKVQLQCSWN